MHERSAVTVARPVWQWLFPCSKTRPRIHILCGARHTRAKLARYTCTCTYIPADKNLEARASTQKGICNGKLLFMKVPDLKGCMSAIPTFRPSASVWDAIFHGQDWAMSWRTRHGRCLWEKNWTLWEELKSWKRKAAMVELRKPIRQKKVGWFTD